MTSSSLHRRRRTTSLALGTATALRPGLPAGCGPDADDDASGSDGRPVTLTLGLGQGHQGGRGRLPRLPQGHQGRLQGDPLRGGGRLRQDLQRGEGGQRPRRLQHRVRPAPRLRQPGRGAGHHHLRRCRTQGQVPPPVRRTRHARRLDVGAAAGRRTPGLLLPHRPLREGEDHPGARHLGRVPRGRREDQEGRPRVPDRHVLPGRPEHLRGHVLAGGRPVVHDRQGRLEGRLPGQRHSQGGRLLAAADRGRPGPPHASFSQQWTNSLQKGETAGCLGASWGGGVLGATLPDQKGKWAAAPVPTFDGRPASGMLGGTTFAVSKDSKKAEAAVEFAEWATTTEAGTKACIASGTSSAYPAAPALVPVAKKAFRTEFFGGQDVLVTRLTAERKGGRKEAHS